MADERVATGELPPSLAEGVELIGEYEGSGFKEPPSLVRRPDGQVIQLPPLLYAVAARADGARGYDEIASDVSAEISGDSRASRSDSLPRRSFVRSACSPCATAR